MRVDPEDLVKCINCEHCVGDDRRRECWWAFTRREGALPHSIGSPGEYRWCNNFSPTLAWTVECMKADLEGLRNVVQSLLDKYEGE